MKIDIHAQKKRKSMIFLWQMIDDFSINSHSKDLWSRQEGIQLHYLIVLLRPGKYIFFENKKCGNITYHTNRMTYLLHLKFEIVSHLTSFSKESIMSNTIWSGHNVLSWALSFSNKIFVLYWLNVANLWS